MANEYLDNLVAELEQSGVMAPTSQLNNTTPVNKNVNDIDLQAIMDIERITGTKFSDEQRAVLEHRGNACILACAGSGKTTTSVNLIAKRIMTGEIKDVNKMIYTTYSKAGATEMKERLDKLLAKLGINKDVQVRTLHAFFLSIIRTFGINSNIISAGERSRFIREACKEAEYLPKDDDLMLIDSLLSYQVNNLLTDKKTIESYVNTIDDLTVDIYAKIRSGYAKKKLAKGLIDYDDMQTYLWKWLTQDVKSEDPNVKAIGIAARDYCKAYFTDFYIDEAQDVSKIQFAIIRAIVTDPNDKNKLTAGLTFIGDDDQCIYTWRGSDPSIILTAGATFNMTVFKLTTNYRCYNEIVDFAANGVKHNYGRYEKDMKAHNQGGSVKITLEPNKDLCSLSNVAMAQIKKWIDDGNSPKDIAVLSRNNFHLAILSNMLLREGIYCNITEEMKLTKSFMYSDIKDLITMSGPTWDSNLTQRLMWKLCRFLGGGNSKMIADFQNTCALSLQDTLGYIVKHYIDDTIVFDKKLGITMQAEQKIEYCIKTKLTADTRQDIKYVYLAISNENRKAGLNTLMLMYEQGTKFLYKSADRSRSIKGLTTYIQQVIEKDGFDEALNFFRLTEQLESGSMVIPGQKITLTTVHSAKGREWKNVIMFACDNISFPSFDGIVSMLNDGISIHDINYSLSEERRLFYVGCTRAKENLLLITYPEPSIFILEALGITKENADTSNAKIIELAQQQDWVTVYKDEISSIILEPSSKYYFDKSTL